VGAAGLDGPQRGEEGEADGAAAAAVPRPPRSRGAEKMAAGRPRAALGGLLPGLLPPYATQVPSARQKTPPLPTMRLRVQLPASRQLDLNFSNVTGIVHLNIRYINLRALFRP